MKRNLLFFIALFISFTTFLPLHAEDNEHILILHGIARSSSSMEDLNDYLSKKGFVTHNTDYASTDYTLEELTKQLYANTKDFTQTAQKTHIVCYSMGCLLTRALIHNHPPKNLGRVVMIGPPNGGSEVADFLKNNPLYQKVYGPAGQQLITDQQTILDFLGGDKVDYETGIIAGNWTIDPISSIIIPGDDDGKVAIENTKLSGAKDHIIVPAAHTFIMQADDALYQTHYFLTHGMFDHAENKE